MPDRIVSFGGVRHRFPADATDDEIRAALGGEKPLVAPQTHPNEEVRQDRNVIGFDQDKWTNIASRLPEKVLGVPVRYPATFLGSLAGTALENLSAPENVATMGAAGMAGRVPALVRPGPLPTVAIRTGTVKALGAAADVVSPDIVGVISPRGAHVLRVVQKLRDAMVKEPNTKAASTSSGAGPPRLVGKAPTLTDSLSSIMDELRTEKGTEANV